MIGRSFEYIHTERMLMVKVQRWTDKCEICRGSLALGYFLKFDGTKSVFRCRECWRLPPVTKQ